jgi:hypothetical protein
MDYFEVNPPPPASNILIHLLSSETNFLSLPLQKFPLGAGWVIFGTTHWMRGEQNILNLELAAKAMEIMSLYGSLTSAAKFIGTYH